MSHKRVYHAPTAIKLKFETEIPGPEVTVYGSPVESNFYCFPDIVLDIIENDPEFFKLIIMKIMTACRGVQFSCGTILTQGSDADIPFLFTDSELKRYNIVEIFSKTFGEEPSTPTFTLIKLAQNTLPSERRETLSFLTALILEGRKAAKTPFVTNN